MLMEVRKREQSSLIATINDDLRTRSIFSTDMDSKIAFLIDTGANVCVYPRKCLSGYLHECTYELYAANSTRIGTYGTVVVDLNLSLRRSFKWRMIVADVDTPNIGRDFLSHCGVLVDPKNKRLIDSTTGLSTNG